MARRPPLVAVTRDDGPDDRLSSALVAGGALVLSVPMIVVAPPEDPRPLDGALASLAAFDWVLFTSPHAVDAVSCRPAWKAGLGSGAPPRLAAVGPATAARLAEAGLAPELTATEAGARALAAALTTAAGGDLRGVRVLWPRSEIARRELADLLAAAGAETTDPVAYRTLPARPPALPQLVESLEGGLVDAVAFLSPSAAGALASALGEGHLRRLRGRTAVASIGPTTSEALRALGAPPDVEAAPRSAEGLAAALLSYLSARQGVSP